MATGQNLIEHHLLFVTPADEHHNRHIDAIRKAQPNLHVWKVTNTAEALDVLGSEHINLVVQDRVAKDVRFRFLAALARESIFCPIIEILDRSDNAEARRFFRSFGTIASLDSDSLTGIGDLVHRRLQEPEQSILVGVSLPGFMQLLTVDRTSTVLRVMAGNRSGALFFIDGRLVDACTPKVDGDAAVLSMLGWNQPRLAVEPLLSTVEQTVTSSLQHLLLEGARLSDERRRKRHESTSLPAVDSVIEEARQMLNDRFSAPKQQQENDRVVPKSERNPNMNLTQSLQAAMAVDGVIGAAVVDYETGLTLQHAGGNSSFDIEMAAASNRGVVRAKLEVMSSLGLTGGIEDILISLTTQYHIIRPLEGGSLFYYVAMDRARGNLGLARLKLAQLEKSLVI